MTTTANTNSPQLIDGTHKQIIIMDQSDFSALNSLIFALQDEELLRKISLEHGFGLGSNQIESVSGLWEKLHLGA